MIKNYDCLRTTDHEALSGDPRADPREGDIPPTYDVLFSGSDHATNNLPAYIPQDVYIPQEPEITTAAKEVMDADIRTEERHSIHLLRRQLVADFINRYPSSRFWPWR